MHLTPLGPDWGWGSRIAEIMLGLVGLVLVKPLIAVHHGIDWLLSKVTP